MTPSRLTKVRWTEPAVGAAASAPSCVEALHLQRLDEADQVALGILELPELDHVHDRLRTHDAGAAEALRLRERLLDVRHRAVEGDVALVPVGPPAMPPPMPDPSGAWFPSRATIP